MAPGESQTLSGRPIKVRTMAAVAVPTKPARGWLEPVPG